MEFRLSYHTDDKGHYIDFDNNWDEECDFKAEIDFDGLYLRRPKPDYRLCVDEL